MERPQAILFDVDGLLITTGGAGNRSWRWAFEELYAIPADIGKFTESGMTDPLVGRLTFAASPLLAGQAHRRGSLASPAVLSLSRPARFVVAAARYGIQRATSALSWEWVCPIPPGPTASSLSRSLRRRTSWGGTARRS